MGKVKEFLQDDKKTTILAFVGSVSSNQIFVIDNEIAYLGSLNFTDFGFQYNNETRIKTTDNGRYKYGERNI